MKKILLILSAVILIATGCNPFTSQKTQQPTQANLAGGRKEVNLSEEFTLKINETAYVRNTQPPVSLQINTFLFPPMGISKSVDYTLTVGDKIYKGNSAKPESFDTEASYIVSFTESDFRTNAKFVINKK
jgi:hypothetical protein